MSPAAVAIPASSDLLLEWPPIQVSSLGGVTALGAGSGFSIALKTDGSVWGWGYGANGQLNSGSTDNRLVPTRMAATSGPFVRITAADYYTLAVLDSP